MILDPTAVANALETAPAWAIMAMVEPSPRIREDARHELAQHLVTALSHPDDRNQLVLPL